MIYTYFQVAHSDVDAVEQAVEVLRQFVEAGSASASVSAITQERVEFVSKPLLQ